MMGNLKAFLYIRQEAEKGAGYGREVMEGTVRQGSTKFMRGFRSVLPVAEQLAHGRCIAGQCAQDHMWIAFSTRILLGY